MLKKMINDLIYKEWEYQSKVIKCFSRRGLYCLNSGIIYEEQCKLAVNCCDLWIAILQSLKKEPMAIIIFSPIFCFKIIIDWIYR